MKTADKPKPISVAKLVTVLKEADQDHEFYPTTKEIIQAIIRDIKRRADQNYGRLPRESVLDIGAGSGKVLLALRDADIGVRQLYAIEASQILRQHLPGEIFIIGTKFEEQSLLSKEVDIIFSNPPYSIFEDWTVKIIRQSAARFIYLVIPERWQKSVPIADALKFRDAKCKIVGQFDFEDAEDRRARAHVHLLRIILSDKKDDAFECFFNEQFAHLINKFKETPSQVSADDTEDDSKGGGRKRPFTNLVVGPSYPDALVNLYTQEMANIQENYRLVTELDANLLREFEVFPSKIMACLKQRLSGLRHDYWHELFSHLSAITSRLTSKSRNNILETLHRHVHVDFTSDNIYAIIIWVIKNANRYIDSQLIATYEKMVAKCNVHLYKSNQRTWVEDRWRYNDDPNSHYALDYRIVMHTVGGINTSYFSFEKGLDQNAAEFLGDLLTIANNLGFRCEASHHCLGYGRSEWMAGKARSFFCLPTAAPPPSEEDLSLSEKLKIERERRKAVSPVLLYDVRAFKNRNLHLRLNPDFILALNVEHGRLKGWLRSAAEATTELGDPAAAQYFQANHQLPSSNPALLLAA